MDGRPTWTDCNEAGDYVVPNVLSPRDLVFRPDNMDETVPHTISLFQHGVSSLKTATPLSMVTTCCQGNKSSDPIWPET